MEKYKPNNDDYKKAEEVMSDEENKLSTAREEGYSLGQLNILGLKRFNNDVFFVLKEPERIEDKDGYEGKKDVLLKKTFGAFEKISRALALPDNEILVCEVSLIETKKEVPSFKTEYGAYSYPDYYIAKRGTFKRLEPDAYATNAYIFIDGYGTKWGGNISEDDYVKDIVEQLKERRKQE